MNENIDLTKILKDCPKGTKLYSPIFGDVIFERIDDKGEYPIKAKYKSEKVDDWWDYICFTKEGLFLNIINTECTLFCSKDQRDWSKFTAPWYKKERFDPKTLKQFDKILVQRYDDVWLANFLSHYYNVINPDNPDIRYLEFITITNGEYRHCIPYNDKTKYLLGTTDEAPEYYRYWED